METRTRKSSALISLVLVPLNLMGLGYVAGCDSRSDDERAADAEFAAAVQQAENGAGDASFEDPDDPYTLDPVENVTTGPTTQPSQTVGNSNFAHYPNRIYYHTSGVHFIPIPYRTGYQPMFYTRPNPGVSRSWSSSSSSSGFRPTGSSSRVGSSISHSSGTSRGGFGSHASASS